MLETLLSLDFQAFRWVNLGLSNPVFDVLCPLFRAKFFWAPLYLFLGSLFVLNFGKRGWWVVAALIFTIAIADTVSSRGFKKTFKRLRPCHTTELQTDLRLRVDCGSGYSFTSSHATNHFAVAVFLGSILLQIGWKKGRNWLLAWAAAVSFSQVYVGVHFPLDVLVGGFLGAVIGFLTYFLFKKMIGTTYQL